MRLISLYIIVLTYLYFFITAELFREYRIRHCALDAASLMLDVQLSGLP